MQIPIYALIRLKKKIVSAFEFIKNPKFLTKYSIKLVLRRPNLLRYAICHLKMQLFAGYKLSILNLLHLSIFNSFLKFLCFLKKICYNCQIHAFMYLSVLISSSHSRALKSIYKLFINKSFFFAHKTVNSL